MLSMAAIPYEIFYRLSLYRLAWHEEGPLPELARWHDAGRFSGGRALDVGCGAASQALWLAARGWNATAIDFSPRAVALAAKRSRARGVTLTTKVVDATVGDASIGRHDLVVDRECLQDLKSREARRAYARSTLEWLAPGGALVIATWLYHSAEEQKRFFPTSRLHEDELPDLFPTLRLEERDLVSRSLYGVRGSHAVYLFRAPRVAE